MCSLHIWATVSSVGKRGAGDVCLGIHHGGRALVHFGSSHMSWDSRGPTTDVFFELHVRANAGAWVFFGKNLSQPCELKSAAGHTFALI